MEKPIVPTKEEKIEFNYVEPGWVELAYISPDWNVWKDDELQNLCVSMAAEILEIPYEKISESFYWAEDEPTHHKQLFVKLEKDYDYSFIKAYMNGYVDAIGYF